MSETTMTDLLTTIGRFMGRALTRSPLAATEDFFREGGDSHRAMQVVAELLDRYRPRDAELADRLHEELVLAMFDTGTPQALAVVFGRY